MKEKHYNTTTLSHIHIIKYLLFNLPIYYLLRSLFNKLITEPT
jgi:hypothetical protein